MTKPKNIRPYTRIFKVSDKTASNLGSRERKHHIEEMAKAGVVLTNLVLILLLIIKNK